jgi:predicted nucleic acid-binding protein
MPDHDPLDASGAPAGAPPCIPPAGDAAPGLVLDTNAVLDWLVFRDPRLAALPALLDAQRARWLVTPQMQQEFEHVLARPMMQAWSPDGAAVAAAWARHASLRPAAQPAPWRCKDPSDQMFVDLAVAQGAQALLTRDRSLLALARRARPTGLWICPPERWLAHQGVEAA